MNFPITEAMNGEVKIITAPRRLEGDTSTEFRETIIGLVQNGSLKLVVDLTATQFMDSEGISAIVARISVARTGGGDVRVTCASDFIKNLLHITHLDKLLKNFDDVDTAVNSFKE
jgi:anti-sigma B factor antagonist